MKTLLILGAAVVAAVAGAGALQQASDAAIKARADLPCPPGSVKVLAWIIPPDGKAERLPRCVPALPGDLEDRLAPAPPVILDDDQENG